MDKLRTMKNLANEAVELLVEFKNKEYNLKSTTLKSISSNDTGNTIILEDVTGSTIEYSLSEIAYIFEDGLDKLEIFNRVLNDDSEKIYKSLMQIQKATEAL